MVAANLSVLDDLQFDLTDPESILLAERKHLMGEGATQLPVSGCKRFDGRHYFFN
jgi:hypothetical protein